MYIARIPNRKSRPAILLRESYREGGKVCTRTIANLTNWAPERIVAMERLVKGEFDDWSGEMTSGEIFEVLFALKQLADQVGITRVLVLLCQIPFHLPVICVCHVLECHTS